jgi:hypothetical protein
MSHGGLHLLRAHRRPMSCRSVRDDANTHSALIACRLIAPPVPR